MQQEQKRLRDIVVCALDGEPRFQGEPYRINKNFRVQVSRIRHNVYRIRVTVKNRWTDPHRYFIDVSPGRVQCSEDLYYILTDDGFNDLYEAITYG
jgi:hypothetical protein